MRKLLFLLLLLALLPIAIRTYEAQQTQIGSAGRFPADAGPFWSTYGTKTNTTDLVLQNAPSGNLRVYIYMAYCVNTSASTQQMATITWGSTVRSVVTCGPAGIYNKPTYFEPPLAAPQATQVTMQGVGSATTTYLYAAGTTAR